MKKGNQDVFVVFGYNDTVPIDVADFAVSPLSISIRADLTFSFTISTKNATKVRLEYGIDYVKFNGKRNRKIFKISEVSLKENEKKTYSKKPSFANVSIRKHYPGVHSVVLIINGWEQVALDFELIA